MKATTTNSATPNPTQIRDEDGTVWLLERDHRACPLYVDIVNPRRRMSLCRHCGKRFFTIGFYVWRHMRGHGVDLWDFMKPKERRQADRRLARYERSRRQRTAR